MKLSEIAVPVIPLMTEEEKKEMFASMPESGELPTTDDLTLNEGLDWDFIEV